MEHVYWVVNKLLGGRPGPTREPWDPAALHAGGVRTVISLAAEVKVEDLEPYGIQHYRAGMPPVILFSKGMRKAFIHEALPVWAFLRQQMQARRPTLVHCFAGKDRTGVILAGYFVLYHEAPPEEAVAYLRTRNPVALSAPGYEDTVLMLKPGQMPDPKTLL